MAGFAPATSGPPDRRAGCLRYIPKTVLSAMRNWREEIEEVNPDALFIGEAGDTSFDEAIVGIGERCGQPALIVYDADKIVEVLVKQGMTGDEAREYASFNIYEAWLGPNTPIILH